MNRTCLVTGAAGFIGYFLSRRLLEQGWQVIGADNLNDSYDPGLKASRLELLRPYPGFSFIRADIVDKDRMLALFADYRPEFAVHLAAQAGVRYSLENPDAYIQSNIVGFFNMLEACRRYPVEHLLFASSSSVYGANEKKPFAESDCVDHPVSLYAASKKANELLAHTYSHLYRIPATGLRLFTVYGPLGRPDMAYFEFTQKYFAGEPIRIYNNGDFAHDLYRDFTYIDDIVEGIVKLLPCPPERSAKTPCRLFNIGNNQSVRLTDFITTLEHSLSRATGRNVVFDKIFEPLQPGDVTATLADTGLLEQATGFRPSTPIEQGLQKFADWYVGYYQP